ncbi:MAG: FAD-dependent oxidoreductase, partial [Chloroflexi bacterium]|nr:FAD-dependent oxidoreductase [Chloroflexota bacterium]
RLYTLAAKPIMEGHVVKGAFLESKSGRQAILAKMVVDATGDADLAAASGAPCEKGRESDRKTRPMALLFRIGNIDYPKLAKYVAENPDDVHPSARAGMLDLKNQVIRIFGFQETCIKAHKNGDLDPDLHYIRFEGMTRASTAILNTTRMYDVDGSKAEDLTKATVIGYKQIRQLLNVMRKYIPGLENIELIEVAPNMGVRESRRIVGEYVYQIEDVSRSTRFPDTLCTTYRQGTPGTEQHSPDGGEGKRRERGPESPPPPPPPPTPRIRTPLNRYHIPYRCLLPQKVENLLVPGRAMSASHLAGVWFRGMPNCVMTGQIAGVSAAVAARLGAVARKVDIAQVQNTLRKQGIRIE